MPLLKSPYTWFSYLTCIEWNFKSIVWCCVLSFFLCIAWWWIILLRMLSGAVVSVQADGRIFCDKSTEEGRHNCTWWGGEFDVRETCVWDGQLRPASVPRQPHGLLPDQGQLLTHLTYYLTSSDLYVTRSYQVHKIVRKTAFYVDCSRLCTYMVQLCHIWSVCVILWVLCIICICSCTAPVADFIVIFVFVLLWHMLACHLLYVDICWLRPQTWWQ